MHEDGSAGGGDVICQGETQAGGGQISLAHTVTHQRMTCVILMED